MPYTGKTAEGEDARQQLRGEDRFFLARAMPDSSEEELEALVVRVESLQWRHSSFQDPGEDWNRLILTMKSGEVRTFRESGY